MTREEYGEAYEEGFRHTVRFLMSRGIQREAAIELAQAAWARGWERRNQLRVASMVCSWVNSIALNLYRSGLRRTQLDLQDNGVTNIDLAAIDVTHILRSCSPRDQALLLRELYGFTAAEIAHEEKLTQSAVRIRLMRARRAARAQLSRTAHFQTKSVGYSRLLRQVVTFPESSR